MTLIKQDCVYRETAKLPRGRSAGAQGFSIVKSFWRRGEIPLNERRQNDVRTRHRFSFKDP